MEAATKTKAERCDACGAEAWYFAEVKGTMLAYCGHHGTEYEVKLMPIATKIRDLRYLIGVVD